MSGGLPEFLLARIAEREAVARGFLDRVADDPGSSISLRLDHPELAAGDCPSYLGEYDPARVLAGCERDRRIVELHGGEAVHGCPAAPDETEWIEGPCATLRALALPYADRPGYREEWRP